MFCYNALQMGSWGHEPYCIAISRDNFAVTDGKCLTFHNGGNCLKHCVARDVPSRVAARTFVLLRTLKLLLWLGAGQSGEDVCLGILLTS
jgi:hypothetical protein